MVFGVVSFSSAFCGTFGNNSKSNKPFYKKRLTIHSPMFAFFLDSRLERINSARPGFIAPVSQLLGGSSGSLFSFGSCSKNRSSMQSCVLGVNFITVLSGMDNVAASSRFNPAK